MTSATPPQPGPFVSLLDTIPVAAMRQRLIGMQGSRGINTMIRDQVRNNSPKVNTKIRDQARSVATQQPDPPAA